MRLFADSERWCGTTKLELDRLFFSMGLLSRTLALPSLQVTYYFYEDVTPYDYLSLICLLLPMSC